MFNSPLIRPYLLGGVALGGGTLDSHEILTGGIDYSISSRSPMKDFVMSDSTPQIVFFRINPSLKNDRKF